MNKDQALKQVAAKIGVPSDWLDKLITFESGWKADAKNKFTGARGLIQFMPDTARALGYKDAEDLYKKHPTAVSQLLNPVLRYFQLPGNRPPYATPQSLYMTVFYPAARYWTPDTVFSAKVRAVNPGIVTVQDYVNKVERRKVIKTATTTLALVALLAMGAYYLYTHKPKGDLSWKTNGKTPQIYMGV